MTVPVFALEVMVYGALAISALTPAVLLALLFRDWKGGKLW